MGILASVTIVSAQESDEGRDVMGDDLPSQSNSPETTASSMQEEDDDDDDEEEEIEEETPVSGSAEEEEQKGEVTPSDESKCELKEKVKKIVTHKNTKKVIAAGVGAWGLTVGVGWLMSKAE